MKAEEQTRLKAPMQIGKMSKDEMIVYIDYLQNCIKDYQIAFDQVIQKNKNFT